MPEFLVKALAVVVLLGGLIFVHELGHFLVAKLLGVKVVRFSIGFGPRLLGFDYGETEYRVSVLPLGGYVKMAGEDPTAEVAPEDRGRGFLEQRPWRRLLIAAAGPTMNLLLPFVLFGGMLLAMNGTTVAGATVGTVTPGSPAERAGLRPGDRILSVEAPGQAPRHMRQFLDLMDAVAPHPGEPLVLAVERDGKPIPPITVEAGVDEQSNGVERIRRGIIGITPFYTPARVAPTVPGAAGPLEPFDLVVSAGGVPVRSAVDLERALGAAACGPVDLEVLRERPRPLPGAVLAGYSRERLAAVPTCRGGAPTLRLVDPYVAAAIAAVDPGGPADRAGLRRGDVVTAVNGRPVHNLFDLAGVVARELSPSRPGTLTLADGRTVTVTPGEERFRDETTGREVVHATVGLSGDRRALLDEEALRAQEVRLERTVPEIAALAWKELGRQIRTMVLGIMMMFTGKISLEQVGGPIQIIKMTGEAVEQGWGMFLTLMAFISVNLGLMNLLPIPILDGGHIAQAAVESVTRRPLSLRTREIANVVGIILLVSLMVFAFKNDIVRQLQGR
ncbi:MAG TPA: site-2 protease family protein [Anaeromyxobacter sp.]|nr:site-2 protease family protein [Anaeromyxobacter sp.]